MSLLLAQTRPVCIRVRGFFALRRKGARQRAEDIQIQARGRVGAGVVLLGFEGARVLGGVLDGLGRGGGGFGDLVWGHDEFYLTERFEGRWG